MSARLPAVRFAFDKSVRRTDADGVLHVSVAHISKAAVNGYLGREIPGGEALGLEPDKLYQLLRDPAELARAAPTFNNKPLLNKHVPFDTETYDPKDVVGSIGSDVVFASPFLDASLSIWDAAAIAGVEGDVQREISCSYRYVVDMTPGQYKGLRYDGVMRDIACNHVALVEAGRAGSDVIVGDAKPEIWNMAQALKSRKAILARGALTTYLTPLLAADAKLDLSKILAPVTRANFPKMKDKIVSGITKATANKLAADADLDGLMTVVEAIQSLDDGDEDEDDLSIDEETPTPGMDNDGLTSFLKDKLSPEDHAKACAMMGPKANDEGETDEEKAAREKKEKDGKDKPPAMDAKAAQKLATDAENRAIARMTAIRVAEKEVRPYVGELEVAMDSADEVYRFALDSLEIDHEGVSGVALSKLLKAVALPGTVKKDPLAMDAATSKVAADEFASRFLTNA